MPKFFPLIFDTPPQIPYNSFTFTRVSVKKTVRSNIFLPISKNFFTAYFLLVYLFYFILCELVMEVLLCDS